MPRQVGVENLLNGIIIGLPALQSVIPAKAGIHTLITSHGFPTSQE